MIDEIIPKFTEFQWIRTCLACPVQFDIYTSRGKRIAYFRFRGNNLSVNNYNGREIGNDMIYFDNTTYEGSYLSQEELDQIVPIVEQKIKEYYGMD